jgi:hypothetical protein
MSRKIRIGMLVLGGSLLLAMPVATAGAASDSVETEKVILRIEGMT